MPPRDARAFEVPAGHLFRIVTAEGSQVGDLNLWNASDLRERFYSGKTRALQATHVSTGDRLWSTFPWLRPMATITHDTLDWYGIDEFGAGVHDVIGTRCDPYTNFLLTGGNYHYCCHSNLTRALASARNLPLAEGRNARARRGQYLHVYRLHARHEPVLHEGEPFAGGGFHRAVRRDRSAGGAIQLSGRRLRVRPLQRRCDVPSAAHRNPPPAGRASGELAAIVQQRVRRQPRGRLKGFSAYSREVPLNALMQRLQWEPSHDSRSRQERAYMPGARTCRADAGFPNTTVVIYGCRLSIILPKRHSGPDPEIHDPGRPLDSGPGSSPG